MMTLMWASASAPAAFSAFTAWTIDDVAPLHVDDAGTSRLGRGEPFESLERVIRIEHRVEMANQQDVRAATVMFRNEVPGTVERCAVHPTRPEAHRVELRAEAIADPLARRRGSSSRC